MHSYSIVFCSTRPGLSAEQLDQLSASVGAPLPPDYQAFLSTANGGVPELGYFDADGLEGELWLEWFCWVDEDFAEPTHCAEYDSLAYAQHKYRDCVPADTLIIGQCCRDDLLLLGIRGKRTGRVLYKAIAELPGFDRKQWGELRESHLYPVADSFRGFVKMLREEQDEEP